ncbi:MBL fold metallo-hydrolase, partial [Arthrospira platensis SPKY1]|nr:MBL fold metallo-hydrolase [Arthrospira platensis SPKY1]
RVFQRDWLSSNNVLFLDDAGGSALVDSGYHSHAEQTCALVEHGLAGRSLALLVNTHLHSDHCGGNARLQRRYPGMSTLIPPGQADAVCRWDLQALTYGPTGQECEPFRFDGLAQ